MIKISTLLFENVCPCKFLSFLQFTKLSSGEVEFLDRVFPEFSRFSSHVIWMMMTKNLSGKLKEMLLVFLMFLTSPFEKK